MNFFQIIGLLVQIEALVKELEEDGTLDKVKEAIEAVEAELKDPKATQLIEKLKQLFHR